MTLTVDHAETNLFESNRDLTVDAKDSVAIGGKHDKTINGDARQSYRSNHDM